jgi:hypothetical protein
MKWIATTWLWIRRLFCFLFAAFLAGGAGLTVWRYFHGSVPLSNVFYSLAAVGVAAWFVWLGVYGASIGSSGLFIVDAEASKQMHNTRKRRYGWRW